MEIERATFCSHCGHKGMKRETREFTDIPKTLVAISSCENVDCNHATGVIIMNHGSLKVKMGGMFDLGQIFDIDKRTLDERYSLKT